MIDVGTEYQTIGENKVDISGENYGYIASHVFYGNYDYWNSHSWTLTLTGFQSTKVEIDFEKLELEQNEDGRCYDYLLIDSLDKLCKKPTNPITLNMDISTNTISFHFITDTINVERGFWLLYKGNVTLNL